VRQPRLGIGAPAEHTAECALILSTCGVVVFDAGSVARVALGRIAARSAGQPPFFGQNAPPEQVLSYTALAPTQNFWKGILQMNLVREASEAPTDNLHSLEEKIFRTIELLKAAREAKAAADKDIARLRDDLQLKDEELEIMRSENLAMRQDREDVRGRVEKLLEQIDTIEE
jgi:hypothetical protein